MECIAWVDPRVELPQEGVVVYIDLGGEFNIASYSREGIFSSEWVRDSDVVCGQGLTTSEYTLDDVVAWSYCLLSRKMR